MTDELEQPVEAVMAGEPVGATEEAADEVTSPAPNDPGHASLLAIVDRLGGLLERSDLTEIEVEVGGTAVILRKPSAFL
jgi:hypothetical protein